MKISPTLLQKVVFLAFSLLFGGQLAAQCTDDHPFRTSSQGVRFEIGALPDASTRRLNSLVMLHYKGDRSQLRSRIQELPLIEKIEVVATKTLNPRDEELVTLAYWAEGCIVEALDRLKSEQYISPNLTYLGLPSNDGDFFISASKKFASYPRLSSKFSTLGELMLRPAASLSILETLENETVVLRDQEIASHLVGVRAAVSILKREGEFFSPELPDEPSYEDYQRFYSGWLSVALWTSMIGHCGQLTTLLNDLWEVRDVLLAGEIYTLEAIIVRCISEG